MRKLRLTLFTLFFGIGFQALSAEDYLILVPTIERDFLMEGDRESPARNGVPVEMRSFVFTTAPGDVVLSNYRYQWTLEVFDTGAWNAVELANGDTTKFSDSVAVGLTDDTSDEIPSSQWVEITDSLDPLGTLDPQKQYRVRGQLQEQPFLGSWANVDNSRVSSARQIFHFTNSASNDNARNVIAELDSVSVINPLLLDGASDSSKRGFTVETDATIRRWDAYNSDPISGFVSIRYEFELRDAVTDALIPLHTSTFTRTEYISTYDNSGAQPEPSETGLLDSFTLQPLSQLDPTGDHYYVQATISHLEATSPTTVYRAGNSLDSPDSQLLHFNGSLEWSGISSVLTDFTRSPLPATSNSLDYVSMTLNGVAGNLAAGADYDFNAPASVTLRLYSDGTAVATAAGAALTVGQPFNDIGSTGGVRFLRSNLSLLPGGLSGNLLAYLPQGMSYRLPEDPEHVHRGTLAFNAVALNNALTPTSTQLTYNPGAFIYVSEETKPLAFEAEKIDWTLANGDFTVGGAQFGEYVRANENDFLNTAPVAADEKQKHSNTGYYGAFRETTTPFFLITTEPNHSAALQVELILDAGDYLTHFPYGTRVAFSSGAMQIDGDVVVGGQLDGVQALALAYERACIDRGGAELAGCGSGSDLGIFLVDVKTLEFTPDGGLIGSGSLKANALASKELSWGKIDSIGAYAHTLSGFTDGSFHITGHFIPGMGGDAADFVPGAASRKAADAGPANTLLAAVKNSSDLARPGSVADAEGLHAYAGVNLAVGSDGAVFDLAYIAGQAVPYPVRGCNRLYVRRSGVTGTLEGVPDQFPSKLTLYNYDFEFSYYGLGFIQNSTSPEMSFTAGAVATPYPADAIFEFDGMSFTCAGGLAEARLPSGGLDKRLNYWAADFDVATLSFTSSDGCDPSADAFLTLGATIYSTLLDTPLHGIAGIDPDGELIDKAFSEAAGMERTVTSRFRLPNRFELKGPAEEVYAMMAISEAYFNDYAATSEQNTGQGRLNFAATSDVPFFEDLEVHVRTTASQTINPNASVQLMGGWSSAGESFFNSVYFDDGNRAWPDPAEPAHVGVTEAVYRNQAGAAGDPSPYLIHARQKWLGVVNFDYPLQWNSSLRSFTSYTPTKSHDLLVVTIDHQLDYLSAENAELTFGAVYEGLPRISLTNFAFNKLDESTGALNAMTQGFRQGIAEKGGAAVGALEDGINGIDNMLQDQVDSLLEDFYSATIDPIVEALYNGLDQLDHQAATANEWIDQVEAETNRLIVSYIPQGYDPAGDLTSVRDAIKTLDSTAADSASFINKVDDSLAQLQAALRLIHDRVYLAENSSVSLEAPAVPNPANTIQGLLYEENGEFSIASSLVSALIAELSSEIGGELAGLLGDVLEAPVGELNTLINQQLDDVRPALEQVRSILAQTDATIGSARAQISAAGELVQEVRAILDAADALINEASTELQVEVRAIVLERIPQPSQFAEYTEAELKVLIRQAIQDKIRELPIIPEFQLALRQRFYDLDLQIKESIDTAFAQINTAIKGLLQDYLAEFDEEINGFLGDLGSSLGAAEINGFAHINGDALRLLRLDAYLQMQVPDAMEFNGYLQIKQLVSDGSDACSYGLSDTANEVTLGALGVPVAWIGDGMEVDVEGKVVLVANGAGIMLPLGMGGRVEMTAGEIGFEGFTITDLGAAMSFGVSENYIAAEVGLRFQSYAMYGGVFFGQTCDIAPLEMVNEQAASVLGSPNPTFTGAYVYGEAHIPVSEALLGIPASCMFKITAGVGAGAFYFTEGPTFGGQMLLAVSGEALCLVGIKGELSLVGAKVADDLRFSGRGRLTGKVGSCPFCVKFRKTLDLEYKNDRWSYDF